MTPKPRDNPPQSAVDTLSARLQSDPPRAVAEAAEAFTAQWPDHPMGWFVHATAAQRLGDHKSAVNAFDRLVRLRDDVADVWANMGWSLRKLKRAEEAVAAYRRALAIAPESAPVLTNLAAALLDLGRAAEARDAARQAAAVQPDYAAAHANLGRALNLLGHRDAAEAALREAVALDPDSPGAYRSLARTLVDADRLNAALAVERTAAQRGAHAALPAAERAYLQLAACDWAGLDAVEAAVLSDLRDRQIGFAPFTGLLLGLSGADQMVCARRMACLHQQQGEADKPAVPRRDGPLRVGYLSADFHNHATAWLLAEVIEQHDPAWVTPIAYDYGPDDGSAMRARLKAGFARFVDLVALTDDEAAARIRADGVDILVDLKGYTKDCRPGIPARRPAPAQVNYLGYPGTMGAEFIDYIIGDPAVTPMDDAPLFDECIVQLPHSYQPNDRQRRAAETTPPRSALGLPETGTVFCCFNNTFKIRPEVFDRWMRILRAVPESVLWLFTRHDDAMANLWSAAQTAGVSPARLVFAEAQPFDRHLARYRQADLFLDTLPYGAHTTASDALWMGVPVLTQYGDGFPGRVGAGLVRACGLPELVVADGDAYVAEAIRLGRDSAALAALRNRLQAQRDRVPLFDSARYTRALESAYRAMADRAAKGLPPVAMAIADDMDDQQGTHKGDKA